jgi:AraC-like DNA-binding protein
MKMNSNQQSDSIAQESGRPGAQGDVLTSVLSTFRLCRAMYCASELSTPWGIHFDRRPNPIFHVVDRGAAWLVGVRDGERAAPVALVGGDLVMLPHGHAHTLADEPSRKPKVVDFADHPQIRGGGGPAIWGGEGAKTLLVCGQFELQGPAMLPLLAELPALIVLRSGEVSEWLTMTMRLLAHEALGREPGAALIMGRLVEVIFIQCLRAYLRRDQRGGQGWLSALREPSIARALFLMHQRPEHPYTVEELGRAVGLSRSIFAERFATAVGEPPLCYLTRWRMQLSAARLLGSPTESLKSVAAAAGYSSLPAWNRAFRRFAGLPPLAWRQAQQPPSPQ